MLVIHSICLSPENLPHSALSIEQVWDWIFKKQTPLQSYEPLSLVSTEVFTNGEMLTGQWVCRFWAHRLWLAELNLTKTVAVIGEWLVCKRKETLSTPEPWRRGVIGGCWQKWVLFLSGNLSHSWTEGHSRSKSLNHPLDKVPKIRYFSAWGLLAGINQKHFSIGKKCF